MIIDRKTIKIKANEVVKNNSITYGLIVFQWIMTYVFSLIVIALFPQTDFMQSIVIIINGLISSMVAFFIAIGGLKVIRDEDWISKEEKWTPYHILRYFPAALLSQLFIFLWTLLFIVPGVIKALSYSMLPYILKDDHSVKAKEAITQSREMMVGHKLDLFILYITYYIVPFLLGVGGAISLGAFLFRFISLLDGYGMETSADSSFFGFFLLGIVLLIASFVFYLRNITRCNIAVAIFYETLKEKRDEELNFPHF